MKKRFVFVCRGFQWDYWRDVLTDKEFRFEMGEDPNDYELN